MEWMVVNPLHVHGTFASVGVQIGDSYHVNQDCLSILGEILEKLHLEDKNLRNFRRVLGFTQVIKKDLLPLLINVKDDFQVSDTTVRILVNLTIPVECLLPMDVMFSTDVGRHTTVELNRLLLSGKESFVDARSTRAVVNHIKRVLEKGEKLTNEECESINNCLLLMRNVLHIPEMRSNQSNLQNQILWNLFTQSIDKILIHLMTCTQKAYWGITMVQLIAIMYKDQHVGTLQKLLNVWFEASLSESSEDNESNTSPPDQGSGGVSSMLTSDPTSDSSDNGSCQETRMQSHTNCNIEMDCKSSDSEGTSGNYHSKLSSHSDSSKSSGKSSADSMRKGQSSSRKSSCGKSKKERLGEGEMLSPGPVSNYVDTKPTSSHSVPLSRSCKPEASSNTKFHSSSELSDYGYGTQVENQESISTSSNEDECLHTKRPVHQKPHIAQKPRMMGKSNISVLDKKELRRKKLVKRSRTNIMNMKALLHHTPSDEDISNLLKEFTVDFLLKGYGSLVQELHSQLLNSKQTVQVDTSHFFWLVTYFLKFATQLELELEHVSRVLSFEIISYLTYEGVNLCEQLELASHHPGSDLKPYLRRMHLVVTAIREFIQAIETYRKITHLGIEDREHLLQLQIQIGSTEDLKCLFVLLLHQFNPALQSKQYLIDLIVTNHMLLLLLDNVGKLPGYKGNINIMEHIKQFATVEVMHQYGLLLEDFQNNGEFINDCVFTMMHHIGGDIEQVAALFQPNILKTFSKIWESDYEVCDDWSDLIEYVIHKFIDKPRQCTPHPLQQSSALYPGLDQVPGATESSPSRWTKDELDSLYWFYVQSAKCPDPVGRVKDLYVENGITNKSRIGIIQQLLSQDIINKGQFEKLTKKETTKPVNDSILHLQNAKESKMSIDSLANEECEQDEENALIKTTDHIALLRDQMLREKKGKLLTWLQKFLIEACYVKLNMDKLLSPPKNMMAMEPVPHHFSLMNQSIPVIPWNSDQKKSLLYQPFVLLLHKLGFHLPADSGKIYVRIPNFWTPDVLFSVAQKLGPISRASLKFDEKLIKKNCLISSDSPPVLSCHTSGNQFAVQQVAYSSPVIRSTPLPNSTSNWLQLVMQSKVSASSLPQRPITPPTHSIPAQLSPRREADHMCSERGSDCSVCETAEGSIASDLTRMYVSDEEERQELQI